jgi:nucleoside 2-deoxyribosyltransferase
MTIFLSAGPNPFLLLPSYGRGNKMKAYLAIKFKEDFSNKETIENISNVFEKAGIESVAMALDGESSPKELMEKTFKEIDSCDLMIIEFSEKGVGLGIEAGYAFARQKPIFVIAKEGSDISSTLKGISKQVIFYNDPEEIMEKLKLI